MTTSTTAPRDCGACNRRFTCDSAYHLHLLGRRAVSTSLRCRTDEEMHRIGMEQTPDGAWKCRVANRTGTGRTVGVGRRRPFV